MTNESPPVSRTNTRHYCRRCGEVFDPDPKILGSPHVRESLHRYHQHPDDYEDYQGCSKNCMALALPQEIAANRRMYGHNVPKIAPRVTYDELFSSEEEA
jgi:hypothetical protein